MKKKSKRHAQRLVVLLGGEGWLAQSATAVVFLLMASLVGTLLALAAARWGNQLENSEIITELTGSIGMEIRESQDLLGETPQNAELFFAYLNALAPAVNEITVLPGRQIRSYSLLQESARSTGVALSRFWMEDTSAAELFVEVTASDRKVAEQFTALLATTADFSQTQIIDQSQEEEFFGQQYTIKCTFSPLF